MNSQELRNLQEAYLEVYEQEEVLDEVRGGGRIDPVSDIPGIGEMGARSPKDAGLLMSPLDRAKARANALTKKGNTKQANQINSRFVKPTERAVNRSLLAATNAKSAERRRIMNPQESYDLYDVILSHLINEGYADTLKGAEVMLVNMSEEWRESIVEKFSMAADPSKPQSPKPTKLPISRERNIGRHNDWADKPTEWDELPPAAKKLRSRAITVTGTQRRQDMETGVR